VLRVPDVAPEEREGVRLEDLERLHLLFERLQEITQEVGAPTTPRWQTATFTLQSDGEFDVKFGYDDGEDVPAPASRGAFLRPIPHQKRPWWRFWGG
jgi:hypothetical protein